VLAEENGRLADEIDQLRKEIEDLKSNCGMTSR